MKQLRAPAARTKLAAPKPPPSNPPPPSHAPPPTTVASLPFAAATHGLTPSLPGFPSATSSSGESSSSALAHGGRSPAQVSFSDRRRLSHTAGAVQDGGHQASWSSRSDDSATTTLAEAPTAIFNPREQLEGSDDPRAVAITDADILCLERAGGLTRAYRADKGRRTTKSGRGGSGAQFVIRCFDKKQGPVTVRPRSCPCQHASCPCQHASCPSQQECCLESNLAPLCKPEIADTPLHA